MTAHILDGTKGKADTACFLYEIKNRLNITKVILESPLTFYDERDAEHCQSSYAGTSISRSSIGDHLPCGLNAVLTEFTELH